MNFFNAKTEQSIIDIIARFMNNVLNRRLIDEPWNYEDYKKRLPFHVALVPEEIWKSAKFERSFVTSLGMIGWQDIARAVAEDKRGFAKCNYKIEGKINSNRLNKIYEILNQLEKNERKPNWDEELKEIFSEPKGELDSTSVIADLYVENIKTKEKFCFEIKSPLPNSDQTKVSKEKILKLYSLEGSPIRRAYFALPFNPFGSKVQYNHPYPFRWFNMRKDEVVIMAESFWDLLGGQGTYEALIEVFEKVGKKYKDKIRKEYLNIKI